jgi:precorrin-2 dehydrogenase/sirohydrochlorin ferrochelatase
LDSFPAYFPLAGRKVVIAGSGEAADNKARLFDGSPATLVRVDGHAAFLPGTYAGAVLAFVAGDDEVFLQSAASAARAARVLVNVVDKPAMSDFNTPAVIDRGEVVAAVGTGGASPTLATKLRNDIEAQVPEGSGRVAALLRKFQDEVRGALPAMHERRAFLRDAVAGEAAQAAMAGDMDKAGQLFRQALAKGVGREGKVRFIAGGPFGPADAPRASGPGRGRRADRRRGRRSRRRDHGPPRRSAAGARRVGAETLVELAQEGKQIVRLIVAPVDPALVQALAAASVAVEVL